MIKTLKKNQNVFLVIGVTLIILLLILGNKDSINLSANNLSGAAAAFERDQSCNTTNLLESEPAGIVIADPLNFRVGPGLNYQIITSLDYCTPLTLLGRTDDASWLAVRMPGNREGWVFSYYVQTNINIVDLEVTTGFGGPTNNDNSGGNPKVSVVIQDGQAVVFVTGVSANTQVSATLGPTQGSSKNILVSSGSTDGDGSATLIFSMPYTWSDGSVVESGAMSLTVIAGDDTVNASLTYYYN